MRRKFKAMLTLIFILVAYYSLFFGYVLSVKDSMISYLSQHNMTKFDIGKAIYNQTSGEWETKTETIDLTGFLDLIFTFILVLGPLFYAFHEFIR